MNNDQLEHVIKMLEHYECEALNLEVGIRQLRNYVEIFLKDDKDEWFKPE